MKRPAQSESDPTVSTQVFRPILLALEMAGVDIERFAAQVELPLDVLSDRDRRLPRELAVRTWIAAEEAAKDDVFGVHVAELAPVGVYGAFEYSARSSPTIGHALKQFARYYSIVSDHSSLTAEMTSDSINIRHNATSPAAVVDSVFVSIMRVGRELTGVSFVPREVRLTRNPPKIPGDHERVFRAPIHFSSDANVLVFDMATLDLPLMTADAELHATLIRRTEAILAQLPSSDRFLRTVRMAVIKSLQSGEGTSLDVLGTALGMSGRTLQRRLAENATTQKELVDQVRHELALSYLADDHSSIEIAYLLGFSEVAALHRAFRRWTGSTVKEFRARSRNANDSSI